VGGKYVCRKTTTERKSANHQVTAPFVKPDCIETDLPFDLNSALPVPIDHPLIRTSDTALSDALFEPPPASEKEPTTHAIKAGDGNEENGFATAASATKELALAVEVLIDNDCPETHEDEDLTTVALADKGKGVDPQEYDSALYDPNSMVVPAGTTSTGGSGSIELVDVHREKGNNVDPVERRNGMAKYEPGPSQIDIHDHGAVSFQEQGIPFQSFDPTLPRLSWHPKISPYRLMVLSTPLATGTAKAVLGQMGSDTTPVTLEWISGLIIFLV